MSYLFKHGFEQRQGDRSLSRENYSGHPNKQEAARVETNGQNGRNPALHQDGANRAENVRQGQAGPRDQSYGPREQDLSRRDDQQQQRYQSQSYAAQSFIDQSRRDPPPHIHQPNWRQPVFHPTARKDEMIARDRMRPMPLGGKSKKDALGSVAESWGPIETRPYGMFEIEEDPPSRSTSPYRQEVADEAEMRARRVEETPPSRYEVKVAKRDALEKARLGTPYQR